MNEAPKRHAPGRCINRQARTPASRGKGSGYIPSWAGVATRGGWSGRTQPRSESLSGLIRVNPDKKIFMNEAHRGKFGHRPKALQKQVNRRLEKGDFGAPTSRRHWTPRQPTRPLRIQPWHNVVTRKAGQRPALRPRSPTTSGGMAGDSARCSPKSASR